MAGCSAGYSETARAAARQVRANSSSQDASGGASGSTTCGETITDHIHWVAVNEGADGIIATGSSDGDEILGFGAHGGNPSPPCRTYIRRNTGKGTEDIRLKPHRLVPIQPGDIIVKHSSGGGGVGPPEERDPELVRQDVVNELVSLEAARTVYKVVLDPRTLSIQWDETRNLRGGQ